ncbi:hypothetical protein FOMPIDRAFT_1055354 [Fomitopsis schrenkii]|uniref:Uncharacterized protein n=1 Tax=Fomitopsis schrenkii TaxID=2126942 RepID=S8F5G4_FOMSC|nr:hypothetical protein FOMPIDRAFT_1055354 [Fomitopsis schrenkii]
MAEGPTVLGREVAQRLGALHTFGRTRIQFGERLPVHLADSFVAGPGFFLTALILQEGRRRTLWTGNPAYLENDDPVVEASQLRSAVLDLFSSSSTCILTFAFLLSSYPHPAYCTIDSNGAPEADRRAKADGHRRHG